MKTQLFSLFHFLFLVLSFESLEAQNTLFFSTYGSTFGDEEMETIIQTSDLGLLIVGTSDSYSTGGDDDLILLKTDINGNILWSKTYGGTSSDMATDVKVALDSGYIVAGWTKSFGAGGYDFWILKLDIKGNIEWQKRYGGSGNDQAWSVFADTNSYLVVGGTNSFGAGLTDLWALKLDLKGNIVWQNTYGSSGDDAPPGPYSEYVAKGLIDQNGDYLICGESNGVGHGGTDIYLAKLNPVNGNIVWQYAYGNIDDESIWSFVESPTGGYYLPGNTIDTISYEGDLWVVDVDTSGTIQWQKTFGINALWDEALNAAALADGSIVLASYSEQNNSDWTASAIKADLNGNLVWANQYKKGNLDWTNSVCPLNDNTLAFVGVTTNTTIWNEDIILFRTDSSGLVSNCSFIKTFSPTVVNTNTIKQVINLSVNNTFVNPVVTSASVKNVTLSKNNLCSESLASVNYELKTNDITLYPNPTKGDITIEFNSFKPKVITVLKNQLGQEIEREIWLNSSTIKITFTGAQGIYFLEIIYDNGKRAVFKILKN